MINLYTIEVEEIETITRQKVIRVAAEDENEAIEIARAGKGRELSSSVYSKNKEVINTKNPVFTAKFE